MSVTELDIKTVLDRAEAILVHGENTTYPSITSARHVRYVVRDLADCLRKLAMEICHEHGSRNSKT